MGFIDLSYMKAKAMYLNLNAAADFSRRLVFVVQVYIMLCRFVESGFVFFVVYIFE